MIESENDNGDCSNSSSAASNTAYVTFPCRHQFSSTLVQCPLCQQEDWTPSHFHYTMNILFVLALINTSIWVYSWIVLGEGGPSFVVFNMGFFASFLNTCYSLALSLWIQFSKLYLRPIFSEISNFHDNYMRRVCIGFFLMTVLNFIVLFFHIYGINFLNIAIYLIQLIITGYHIHVWILLKGQLMTQ
jgi:hypothetical protein